MDNSLISKIPNTNSLLEHAVFSGIERERVKSATQGYLNELRDGVISGHVLEIPTQDECAEHILLKIDEEKIPNLRRLINATGIVLHTNLGRAPLGADMHTISADVFKGYCNLEYDLETGQRGSRYSHLEKLICEMTGAQAAMAVNNNAAAVFLMLGALAKGKRVAISRGEMVEIGGAFRVPEIMEQSGAALLEVGTTNRTRLQDYIDAVDKKGAEIILKVHTSNYAIVGFTESVSVSELAAFGKQRGLPVLYDMGSCFLIGPEFLGINAGKTARDGIASGADIICFSGDKLIGSIQAGILAGRSDYIAHIKKHPITRMVRPDKLTLSLLESALRLYRYPNEAKRRIPILAMLSMRPEELKRRAELIAQRIISIYDDWEVDVLETEDEAGGGSLPNIRFPGWAVAVRPIGLSVDELEQRLRRGCVPVIVRIHDGKAMISPRTLLRGEEDELIDALRSALSNEFGERVPHD